MFELVDRLLVWLPSGSGRGERRLQVGPIGLGLSPTRRPVGNLVEEVLSSVFESGPPVTEPTRHRQYGRCLWSGRCDRWELLGELSSLGDRRNVSPVVGQDAFDDIVGFAEVGGLGDN